MTIQFAILSFCIIFISLSFSHFLRRLSCVGRCHLGDLGSMATGVRFATFLVPYDFLASVFSYFAPSLGDYQKYNKNRGKWNKNTFMYAFIFKFIVALFIFITSCFLR